MAAARSAERSGTAASAAAGRSRSGAASGPGSSPREDEGTKCAACPEGPSGGRPPCGHPACPPCRARRQPAAEERLRRRSDPEKSSSRAGRREFFVCPALFTKSADVSSGASGKHKGVLSDSENEEPIRKIRNVSAFVRRTKASLVVAGGAQRSRSCTDPVEVGGGKLKVTAQPAMMDQVGISHSYTAGILLSSENSRSVSAPIAAPDRRLTWRAVITSSSTPLVLPLPQPERSISPESNDSISEELNHFKPIVCSPCTPPKRLPDGRLLEPTIVKSTPRNLTRGLQKSTSYEASPAVLQKWRQIELDRQNLKVNSKATLTSPITEGHSKTNGGEEAAKTRVSSAGDGLTSTNKRRLLFDPPAGDTDTFQKQSVMIRVPALRYSSDATFRGSSDHESTVAVPESCSGGVVFSRKQSFSPYSKNSGFQSCKLVPKDTQSPRKESDSTIHNQSTSRRGKKRKQKTKHLDSERDADLKRSRPGSQDAFDERYICQIQQERQDRVLALKLQRQFDLENQTVNRRRSPDTYFLRSWMSNQNRRRRGLRRSRRINKKY
ncbi:E3 ubiquitin-protein ligase RNF169 isoform X1 [Pleuronectes platessa]|uniref:E3 ubiquitin-protein ligase RNF169 isoform X1 n=1 Tax=Pleuronectes platessa TaxID=8262 RepID=UPI00232A74B8|nr:E3 ubiquitin-protein ligase RNF169 isoform X1 [Pleuronectes platessa]